MSFVNIKHGNKIVIICNKYYEKRWCEKSISDIITRSHFLQLVDILKKKAHVHLACMTIAPTHIVHIERGTFVPVPSAGATGLFRSRVWRDYRNSMTIGIFWRRHSAVIFSSTLKSLIEFISAFNGKYYNY